MTLQSSESIIIKQIDFKDNDKIITFLTKDKGKISGFLRGAKKIKSQNVGVSEPFNHVNIFYFENPHSELVQIRKFDFIDSFYPIRQAYNRIVYATYFLELIQYCIIDPQESKFFFDLLLSTLQILQSNKSFAQLKIQYEKKLLDLLGISPNIEECIQCRKSLWQPNHKMLPQLIKPAFHQFDYLGGGIRCPDCCNDHINTITLSPGTLSYLRSLDFNQNTSQIKATKQNIKELDKAFFTYFQHNLGKTPKSHTLLR